MSQQHQIEKLSVPYDELKLNLNSQHTQVRIHPSHLQQQCPVSSMSFAQNIQTDKMASEAPASIDVKTEHNTSVYIMAGAAAGIMEHCVMYPVDSIKTRLQSLRPHPKAAYTGVSDAFRKISKNEGVLRPLRGINIVAIGAGPSHALYFCSYEMTKRLLNSHGNSSPLANAASGAIATLFHDGLMNPVEVIKQRLQVYDSPYRGVFNCAKQILKTEGVTAFYRSFTTQLTMNIPFHCVHFVMYEFMREHLSPEGGYNPKTHLIAGATAGGIAAAITTPLDVAKTLLNTQEKSVVLDSSIKKSHGKGRLVVTGMVNALRTIHTLRGVKGYFRGMKARVIYQVPSCAISWSVYEFFKHNLSLQISDEEIMDLTA